MSFIFGNIINFCWIMWFVTCMIAFVRYWYLTLDFEAYLCQKYTFRLEEIENNRWKVGTMFRVIHSVNFLQAGLPEDIAKDEEILKKIRKITCYYNCLIKYILISFLLLAVITIIVESKQVVIP